MGMTYFVSFRLWNEGNKGWAYKIDLKTTDKDEAERKFGELIKTYYGVKPFAFGCIEVEDMYGNRIDRKFWDNRQPEPQPEPETTPEEEITE